MIIGLCQLLIYKFNIGYGWMVPSLLCEVAIWVWCFIGYSLSIENEDNV